MTYRRAIVAYAFLVSALTAACAGRPADPVAAFYEGCPPGLSGSTEFEYVYRIPPRYPEGAFVDRIEGYVRIEFDIAEDGRPVNIEVTQERPLAYGFGDMAVRAVEKWRYCPYKRKAGESLEHSEIAIPFLLGK